MSLFDDIFKLCNYERKKRQRPPSDAKVLFIFGEKQFSQLLKKLGNTESETLTLERTLWLWESSSGYQWLTVTEERKKAKGSKKNG